MPTHSLESLLTTQQWYTRLTHTNLRNTCIQTWIHSWTEPGHMFLSDPTSCSHSSIHQRRSVTTFPLTFWPQLYVKGEGIVGGLKVDYVTAVMGQTETRLACLKGVKFSLRYYSSYTSAVQVCAWNICSHLLRLEKHPQHATAAHIAFINHVFNHMF